MTEKNVSTLPNDLIECLDRLIEDHDAWEHYRKHGPLGSQLRETIYFSDKYNPDDPNPPLVKHPLIAFTLAIPRTTSQDNNITVKNGGYKMEISRSNMHSEHDFGWEPKEQLLLPCCKQSRAFCILLLKELASQKDDNDSIQLGSNLVMIAEGLGLGRSGNKDKQGFFDHIGRVTHCQYKSRIFGKFQKIDDVYRFSFGQALSADLQEIEHVFDHAIFDDYMSMLNVDMMKNLGTTYALDFFLLCVDKLIFNQKQKSELVTWDQLHAINGYNLAKKEKYIEEMRKASTKILEYFPQLKLTRNGLRFFPE